MAWRCRGKLQALPPLEGLPQSLSSRLCFPLKASTHRSCLELAGSGGKCDSASIPPSLSTYSGRDSTLGEGPGAWKYLISAYLPVSAQVGLQAGKEQWSIPAWHVTGVQWVLGRRKPRQLHCSWRVSGPGCYQRSICLSWFHPGWWLLPTVRLQ